MQSIKNFSWEYWYKPSRPQFPRTVSVQRRRARGLAEKTGALKARGLRSQGDTPLKCHSLNCRIATKYTFG